MARPPTAGDLRPGAEALARADIEPLVLSGKDGPNDAAATGAGAAPQDTHREVRKKLARAALK